MYLQSVARAEAPQTSAFAPPLTWPREQANVRADDGERIATLDALRGIMALAVAVYHHAVWTRALSGALREAAIVLGVFSVEGFFIISGFCFFERYRRTRFDGHTLWQFHVRRFARIAPLFYLAIAGTHLLAEPIDPSAGGLRLLENLTLTFGLIHPNHAMVLGGWSIGIEYVFYLAFPLLARLTQRRGAIYLVFAVLVACALPYNFHLVAASGDSAFNSYVQIPNHAFLFLAGGVAADLRERLRVRLPLPLALGTIALLWFAALHRQPEIVDHLEIMVGWPRATYVALCFATVALCGLAGGRVIAPLRKLGELSYSVYLMHPLAWAVVAGLLSALSPLAQLLGGLAATLAIATCTQRWIERPAIALARRYTALRARTATNTLA